MAYKKPARPAEPRWLTREEAAALIGVTPRTIDVMVADGRITKYTLGRRIVRFRLTEVEAAFTAVEV